MLGAWLASAHASCGELDYRQADVILEGDVLALLPHEDLKVRFLVRPTAVYRGEVSGDIEVGALYFVEPDLHLIQPNVHVVLALTHHEPSGSYIPLGCGGILRRSTDPQTGREIAMGQGGRPVRVMTCADGIPGWPVQDWASAMSALSRCLKVPVAPVRWTLAAGWRVQRVHPAQDLDGDGLPDLMIELWGERERQAVVVLGPLGRPRALPDEADLTLEHFVQGVGDFTGDGHVDLQVLLVRGEAPPRYAVISGPLARGGPLQLGTERPGGVKRDYDGDGRPDYVEISAESAFARVWTGLEPTWGQGAPTVTFVDSATPEPRGVSLPIPMDIDGDGVPELWWRGAAERVYRGRLRGKIDLARQPEAVLPWPVGDIDGDGVQDWREGVDGPLVAGPWSMDPGAPRRGLFRAQGVGWLGAVGMDLTGDGIAEIVRGPEPFTLIAGGSGPYAEALIRLSAPPLASWVEDGVGWVLVRADPGWELVPLGAATPLPTSPGPLR
jgi:hypothetical protein